MLVPQEISLLLSSATSQGASNKSAYGDRFEIQLQDPIAIPSDALNVTVSLHESTIWWTVINIIAGQNDKMYIDGPDTLDAPQSYIVTIPAGLYDLTGLYQAILRDLANQGAKTDPDPLFTMSPDEPTQKVEITFNYSSVAIDFTPTDTPREILGFLSQVYGPYTAPHAVLADNVASFNTVNSFLVHSDLCSKGIRINNTYSQTIGQVLIDVAPGSQIVSKPYNPALISAQDLAGSQRTNLRVWLTDDQNRPVNTNGEDFTVRIVISYLKPYVVA